MAASKALSILTVASLLWLLSASESAAQTTLRGFVPSAPPGEPKSL